MRPRGREAAQPKLLNSYLFFFIFFIYFFIILLLVAKFTLL